MRLVTFQSPGHDWRAGFLVGDAVLDAPGWTSTRRLLEQPKHVLDELVAAACDRAGAGDGLPLTEAVLGPPVPDPEKIICVGLNYRAHTEEVQVEQPEAPNLFTKFPPSLIGPAAAIVVPPITSAVDWEGELAVVIGRRCKDVSGESALSAVAGCMAFNDVSARDLQMATSQWTAGKALDTFAPCGPAIVSLDELGDIQDLRIQTRVNGATVQDARTDAMIFSVAECVSFISSLMTLSPGDIIATGTPSGVGFTREPPVFLVPGDVVEVEVEGIGALTNPVALAPDAVASGAAVTA
jgi:2-keto-4-pentenoate hydratase/2-oxohepta-3-ene-1,7-dioic acid hydratase in catechol pathway